jgi:hypothetical protein
MDSRHITDGQQLLADLARSGSQNRQETSAVISPGSRAVAWAVKIKSLVSHNRWVRPARRQRKLASRWRRSIWPNRS